MFLSTHNKCVHLVRLSTHIPCFLVSSMTAQNHYIFSKFVFFSRNSSLILYMELMGEKRTSAEIITGILKAVCHQHEIHGAVKKQTKKIVWYISVDFSFFSSLFSFILFSGKCVSVSAFVTTRTSTTTTTTTTTTIFITSGLYTTTTD